MSDATTSNNQRLLNRTGAVIALTLLLILAGGIWLLATHEIPEKNHDIMIVLITAVAANVAIVIGYFFGSSSGTKAKDDALNTAISTAAAIQSALPTSPPTDKTVVTVVPAAGQTTDVNKPTEPQA